MTTTYKGSIVHDNGGIIYPVPFPSIVNFSPPDLSVPDSSKCYDIGTKYEFNGKTYFYAYCTAAVQPRMAAQTSYHQATQQAVIAANALIYATSIVITTASGDGVASDGVFAANALKGGHVVVFVAGSGGDADDFCRGIISSTAVAAAGEVTLELDAPIPHALVHDTSVAETIASPYAYVTLSTAISHSKVGVPACYAAATNYVWLQTWGPCWVAPQSGCGIAQDMGVMFRHDGSLEPTSATISAYISSQYAGWTMFQAAAGTQGAPFVYLQIAK